MPDCLMGIERRKPLFFLRQGLEGRKSTAGGAYETEDDEGYRTPQSPVSEAGALLIEKND